MRARLQSWNLGLKELAAPRDFYAATRRRLFAACQMSASASPVRGKTLDSEMLPTEFHEDAVAVVPRAPLKWQCDEIAKTALRQRILTGEQAVVF